MQNKKKDETQFCQTFCYSKLFFDKLCSLLHSSTTFHSQFTYDVLIFSGSIKMSKIRPLPQNEAFVLHSEAFQNSTKRFLWK